MAKQYEIMSMVERGVSRHQPDFNEMLYEQLKATPWWLASIGIHVFLFVLLNLFVSDSTGLAAAAGEIKTSMAEEAPPMEEEIKPEVMETKPIDEQEKVVETPELQESKVTNEKEAEAQEVQETLGDPRFNANSDA